MRRALGIHGRSHRLASPPVSTGVRDWERAVIARIVAGDDSALAAVFDQYSALVHGIAARLVGRDAASDVCQEVFVQLWEHPERFDAGKASLRTFLAVLARRRAIDQLRRIGRRATNEERSGRQTLTSVPNLEESAINMFEAERVRAAVARLPDDQRRAIELAYFEGLTFREVAVATGAHEGTAKSRLRLGLNRLASALGSEGVVEWA
jgi:RNA polymerase sigma-70 factor, ECF subfamily